MAASYYICQPLEKPHRYNTHNIRLYRSNQATIDQYKYTLQLVFKLLTVNY